jgi:hypothetical protein
MPCLVAAQEYPKALLILSHLWAAALVTMVVATLGRPHQIVEAGVVMAAAVMQAALV